MPTEEKVTFGFYYSYYFTLVPPGVIPLCPSMHRSLMQLDVAPRVERIARVVINAIRTSEHDITR